MNENFSTRREMITGVVAGLAIFGAGSTVLAQAPPVAEQQPPPKSDATRTSLHQEINLHASPQRIYQILLDSKLFSAFSGEAAKIGRKEGSAFSMFGGVIVGRNIELVPGQRIVQAWRPKYWEAGVYSLVRFELKGQGTDTTLILDHTGFPEGDYASLYYGWGLKYWKPLEKYLAV
jgi:activator of HSP90 ATPase